MSSAPAPHPLPTVTVVSSSITNASASQSSMPPLAQLSRNASVISSSSSSSSSSSLILSPPTRPRPVRTFSPSTSVSPQRAGSRAQSPLSPGTPRFSRAPSYLQRQLGIGDDVPPDLTLPPTSVSDSSNTPTIGVTMRASLPGETRSRANSGAATRRLYSPEDFEFGDVLGEGSYSTVLSATYRRTGHVYAVKVLDKHHLQRNNKVKYAYVEKDSLARLSTAGHPGLVRLHWAFSDATSLYFVLDKINNGELNAKINLLGSLSTECARYYTAQMIDVISWMHGLGVLHRDMKPENCLLDDDMRLKITDFGTAKILKEDDRDAESHTSSFVGSPGYISPELLLSYTCGKSADYWAIGCILFQMIAGVQPFKALTPYLSMEKTKTAEYSFPSGFDLVAMDFVQNLLVIQPSRRLGHVARGGVSVLKAHPFFEAIDWENLWTCRAPPFDAGLIRKESKDPRLEGDENKQGVRAAWGALIRDLSEDEMDATEYKLDRISVTNQSPILNEVGPPTHPYFVSQDGDAASTPSTSVTPVRSLRSSEGNHRDLADSNLITNRLPLFGTGNSNASSRDDINVQTRYWHDNGDSSESNRGCQALNSSIDPRPPGSHLHSSLSPLDAVIVRDTHYSGGRLGSSQMPQLSSSAPIRGSPIASIGRSVERPSSLVENGVLSALSTSPASTSSGESQPHAKWSKFLLPMERVIFTSPVLVRRRSILPSRTKPRVLVLTDFPRIICLKTVVKGGTDTMEITEKVKIKTEIFFTPPKQLTNSNSWTLMTGTATLPDVIESNNGDDEDDEDDGIPIPRAGTSKHTHQTRSGSSKPGSGPSSFRSRTMSASSAASMIRRGRSRFRRNSNVLKSVGVKGEKSFVVQTEGKWYTYTAEEQAVAYRWVQEIKNVPIPTPEPRPATIEN